MEKNYPLLRKVFEHISAHPEDHNQQVWAKVAPDAPDNGYGTYCIPGDRDVTRDMRGVEPVCGTAMCVAGWAVAFNDPGMRLLVEPGSTQASLALLADDRVVVIDDHAAEVLGLTHDEAYELFSGGNSLGSIQDLLTEWGALD